MKNSLKSWALMLTLALSMPAAAQQGTMEHKRSDGYFKPKDTKVLEKLDQWKDLKYGVIFHWGLYSVPGIMESWVLCGEDVDWITSRRTKVQPL